MIKFIENTNKDYFFENQIEQYLNEIGKIPLLDVTEELQIVKQIEEGNVDAKEKLFLSNLRLVVSIAKQYYTPHSHMALLDLIQEGNIGLKKAVELFDGNKGTKFSTYATKSIRRNIERAIIYQSSTMKISVNGADDIKEYNQAYYKAQEEGELTIERIAEILGWSIDKTKEIQNAQYNISNPTSIYATVGQNEDSNTILVDFLANPETDETPEELAIRSCLQKDTRQLVVGCNLTEFELLILTLKYGLDGSTERKTTEVAEYLKEYHNYKGSDKWVNQCLHSALNKLRCNRDIKKMAIYMPKPNKAIEYIDEKRKENAEKSLKGRRKSDKPREVPSLYSNKKINRFSKDRIDEAVKYLPDRGKKIISLMFGEDFSQPQNNKLCSQSDKVYFYNIVLKTLEKWLINDENQTAILPIQTPPENTLGDLTSTHAIETKPYTRVLTR